MNVGVIGSGISGLSIANMLREKHDVVVMEQQHKPGGLIKCERVNDCLFHKVGGHVFNSRNEAVLDWFWSYFNRETEFVKASRNAKVFFDHKIIGYPIENYIYLFDKKLVRKIIGELLDLSNQPTLAPLEYDNFEAFLKGNFGEILYEIYFKPYNQKIWRTDLTTVSMEWLEGKLPMPNLKEIIESNIVREEEGNMVHSSFYYSKEGGSQFIVDRLRKDVTIMTDTTVENIVLEAQKLRVGGSVFDKLVYCGDIRKLPKQLKEILNEGGVDVVYLEQLRSNGTSNLFCQTDDNDISWLYIPEDFTRAHRIIYTGNFSATNNRGSDRKTCVVEFSGKVDLEVMKEEIKKLPGNLHALAYNYEPNSYVIQDKRTRNEIAKAKAILEKKGIYLLGRFAEWEYYNMDKAIEGAFAVRDKINSAINTVAYA